MKTTRIVVLIALSVAAGLAWWIIRTRHSNELSSRVFGGREEFNAFWSSPEVTAERLHCNFPGGSGSLSDYQRDSAILLSDTQASELKRVFSDRASFPRLWATPLGSRSVTTCEPHYGLLFSPRSAPAVQIAICFACDQFAVFVGEGDKVRYVNDDDELTVMRPSLVTLAKSIYPNDPEIQDLKPVR